MLLKFVCSSYFYLVCVFIVGGLSVTVRNNNSTPHIGSTDVIRRTLFINTVETKTNFTTSDTRKIRRASNSTKYDTKSGSQSFKNKTESLLKNVSNARKNNAQKSRGKKALFMETLKNTVVDKSKAEMRKVTPPNKARDKNTDAITKRRKLIDVLREQMESRRKKAHVSQDSRTVKILPVEKDRNEYLDDSCGTSSVNETSMSLRNLFRLPRLKKATDCWSRRNGVRGIQGNTASGQSSASLLRLSDRGHTELINQYEKEQSLDEIAGEYVHPEGHNLAADYRKAVDVTESAFDFPASRYFIENYENYNAGMKMHENDYYSFSKHKRNVESIFAYRMKSGGPERNEHLKRQRAAMEDKLFSNGGEDKPSPHARDETTQTSEKPIDNTTSQILMELQHTTETPWPLVPGPISCDLDFQLQPSFVAKLGEFDYVVSVQLQRNPDEPADHACTGVIYNPRFVVIAPHCLHDNYGVTVTSTDDLCTIDEMIDVDYIIEHENYDAETRRHDIALIKLKSEIHKRAAKFPKEDGVLGRNFYAVGFGELMWRSFPTKISKLLQKLPVRRYPRIMKEAPGTLHITTSHMDLTGAFRGDFGGALINPRGEFVGLKSKLVKKSTEYEVYTRVRSYLPWIQSMVALHGS